MNKEHNFVCILGLGYVGLPLACLLATSGYQVVGVDTNPEVVSRVKAAHLINPEPKLEKLLKMAIQAGSFEATNKIASADVFIIAVPTLLGPGNQPDISSVLEAVKAILPYLQKESLVLIESTCPVGTTTHLSETLLKHHSEISLAYCPERVLPGNIIHELVHNHRIVGGIDEASTKRAVSFYQSFVKNEVVGTDACTAEGVKLAENVYRDINIAYANELSIITEHLGLDVQMVIQLANKHPRTDILLPGSGVGGHCIPIDPWYLVFSAPDLAPLISTARQVNTNKVDWIIKKIRGAIEETNAKTIACLGLTYKPNVSALKQSPSLAVAEALEQDVEVLRVDPYVAQTVPLNEALARAEIIVGLVAHCEFLSIPPHALQGKYVFDFAGFLT